MIQRLSKEKHRFFALAFLVLIQACSAGQAVSAGDVSPQPTNIPVSASPTQNAISPTQTPALATSTPVASPTQTPAVVKVTAAKGNLYIRRGPNTAYNPVGVLKQGESAFGLERDVLSKWIMINLPGQPEKTGWVSIQTDFTEVTGAVRDLPEHLTTDWPVAAYLRNCTYHQMIVQPGDTILPSAYSYPDNEVWIYPGAYTVYDYDLPEQPEVMKVDMREGVEIEIRVDGNGGKRKCQ